ncbi:MAG TPA: hypothetical protein VGE47_06640, partial [Burkholderiaceae bacterium]
MAEEFRKRKSWLDGFMAYPLPPSLTEAEVRANIVLLDQLLYEAWALGENLPYAWSTGRGGLRVLMGPHTLLTEFVTAVPDRKDQQRRIEWLETLLSRREHMEAAEFDHLAAELELVPKEINLPFDPEAGLGLELVAAVVERYGIRLVRDRAVILLDAVGFSLLSPLEQVVQLNSLSASVNAAYAKLLDREININFARTT